jgi:hypothetical protein
MLRVSDLALSDPVNAGSVSWESVPETAVLFAVSTVFDLIFCCSDVMDASAIVGGSRRIPSSDLWDAGCTLALPIWHCDVVNCVLIDAGKVSNMLLFRYG